MSGVMLGSAAIGAVGSAAGGGKGDDGGGAPGAPQMYDPFAKARMGYVKRLGKFMRNPSRIYKTQAYKARFAGGQQAVASSAASRGLLDSGAMGIELMQYGQKTAADEYQAEFNRLSQLAGVGISPSWSGSTPQGQQTPNPWGQFAGAIGSVPWGDIFGNQSSPTQGAPPVGGLPSSNPMLWG